MTRDTVLDATDMAHPQSSFRRRTMATSEMREYLSTKGAEPSNLGVDRISPDCVSPAIPTSTRRMSIGDPCLSKIYDWEQPRLDIEGFVADYFSYRIRQKGLEWFEAPDLPCGVQPEHQMMRAVGTIFEKKHTEEFENLSEQLLAVPRISFSLYQEVVQTVGNSQGASCPMNYGRLVGLISFGGLVAAKMMECSELQGQVRNLLMYTSLFIKTRIRQYWKEHKRSWEGFMDLAEKMKANHEHEEKLALGPRRLWSIVGVGVTASAIVGMVVCGKMMFK